MNAWTETRDGYIYVYELCSYIPHGRGKINTTGRWRIDDVAGDKTLMIECTFFDKLRMPFVRFKEFISEDNLFFSVTKSPIINEGEIQECASCGMVETGG